MLSKRTYLLMIVGTIGCIVFPGEATLYTSLSVMSVSGAYDVIWG
jgi:K+ transporter